MSVPFGRECANWLLKTLCEELGVQLVQKRSWQCGPLGESELREHAERRAGFTSFPVLLLELETSGEQLAVSVEHCSPWEIGTVLVKVRLGTALTTFCFSLLQGWVQRWGIQMGPEVG